MPDKISIRVIIVTYNSLEDIDDCLGGLKNNSNIKLQITIVDNASSDATVEYVKNHYPHAEVIENLTNEGYGFGNNVGLKKYLNTNQKPDAFLILNPDAVISTEQIIILYRSLNLNKEVGGVCPLIIDNTEDIDTNYTRSLFGIKRREKYQRYDHVLLADVLHGSCMLIKPELLQTIGFFNESFFLYAEETEFCGRAIKANYKLLVNTDIKINHRTDKEERFHAVYYIWRNLFLLANKQFDDYKRAVYILRRLIVIPKDVLEYIYSKRLDLIQAIFTGLIDGIMGKEGKSKRVL